MNELGDHRTVAVDLELELFVELLLLGLEWNDDQEEVDVLGGTWGFLLFAPLGNVWSNVVMIVGVNSFLEVIDGGVVAKANEVTELNLDV